MLRTVLCGLALICLSRCSQGIPAARLVDVTPVKDSTPTRQPFNIGDFHGKYTRFLEISNTGHLCPRTVTFSKKAIERKGGLIVLPLQSMQINGEECTTDAKMSIRFAKKLSKEIINSSFQLPKETSGIGSVLRNNLLEITDAYYGVEDTDVSCGGTSLFAKAALVFTSDCKTFDKDLRIPFQGCPKIILYRDPTKTCAFSGPWKSQENPEDAAKSSTETDTGKSVSATPQIEPGTTPVPAPQPPSPEANNAPGETITNPGNENGAPETNTAPRSTPGSSTSVSAGSSSLSPSPSDTTGSPTTSSGAVTTDKSVPSGPTPVASPALSVRESPRPQMSNSGSQDSGTKASPPFSSATPASKSPTSENLPPPPPPRPFRGSPRPQVSNDGGQNSTNKAPSPVPSKSSVSKRPAGENLPLPPPPPLLGSPKPQKPDAGGQESGNPVQPPGTSQVPTIDKPRNQDSTPRVPPSHATPMPSNSLETPMASTMPGSKDTEAPKDDSDGLEPKIPPTDGKLLPSQPPPPNNATPSVTDSGLKDIAPPTEIPTGPKVPRAVASPTPAVNSGSKDIEPPKSTDIEPPKSKDVDPPKSPGREGSTNSKAPANEETEAGRGLPLATESPEMGMDGKPTFSETKTPRMSKPPTTIDLPSSPRKPLEEDDSMNLLPSPLLEVPSSDKDDSEAGPQSPRAPGTGTLPVSLGTSPLPQASIKPARSPFLFDTGAQTSVQPSSTGGFAFSPQAITDLAAPTDASIAPRSSVQPTPSASQSAISNPENSPEEDNSTGTSINDVPEPAAATGSTPSPTSDSGSSSCFPAHAKVTLQNGRQCRVDELQIGDVIHVGDGEVSQVFAFSHSDHSIVTTFVNISTAVGRHISASPGHFMYTSRGLVTAANTVVGDSLQLANGLLTRVIGKRAVQSTGLFNPHTVQGDIVVDGFKASTYTSTVEPATAHTLLAPVRLLNCVGIKSSIVSFLSDQRFVVELAQRLPQL